MVRKSYTPEQIINKLREAEILISQGSTLAVMLKKIGVSDCTYYRWRQEYGGMRVAQARRLKELEQENARLKRLVADLSLDKAILTEAVRETSKPVPEKEDNHPRGRVAAYLPETGLQGVRPGQVYPATQG